MSGKIFAESADIYDDQARALCDYLIEAARRIVAEEERIEREISAREEKAAQLVIDEGRKRTLMMVLLACGGIALVLASFWGVLLFVLSLGLIGAGVVQLREFKTISGALQQLRQQIAVFKKEFKAIFRGHRVKKLGIAYVPVATKIPFESGHYLIDFTGMAPGRTFSLHTVKDTGAFVTNIQALEGTVERMPIVESSAHVEDVDTSAFSRSIQQVPYYDYLGTMDRSMRAAAYHLNDLNREEVSLPVIEPDSELAGYLDAYATTDPVGGIRLEVFPTDAHREALQAFDALNGMRKSVEGETVRFEEFLQNLMERLATNVQVVTKAKIASTGALADFGNRVLFTTLKAAYNHYSPQLEAEEIERIRGESFDYQASVQQYRPFALKQSSRVRYDLQSENWVAEDGRRTNFPFGVHQIHEEVLAPIVQNLMRETRLERLRIYENIKAQKLDYLNQWHRDTDDFYGRNRAEGNNLVNLMQASLTDFITAYNQYEAFDKTRHAMKEGEGFGEVLAEGTDATTVLAYRTKMDSFVRQQADFNEYAERLKEEITERAAEFGFIEYFDASLRDAPARDFAVAMSAMDSLDERRRPLIAVNAHFASIAEMPPRPDLGPEVQHSLSFDLAGFARDSLGEMQGGGMPPSSGL